jgi:protein gp37
MATKIEWTQNADGTRGETWNPTTGCDRISPGCDNCYALTMAKRLKAMGQAKYQNDGDPRTSGPGFGLTAHPDALEVPLRRYKPTTWFVNSMSDLGHARVPAEFTARTWSVMARTPQHTYQILSKRPDRIAAWLNRCQRRRLHTGYPGTPTGPGETCYDHPGEIIVGFGDEWPLRNVHIGTSIELDAYCHRADSLRETPAAVRFLSLEPLLGPLPSLDLTGIDWAIIGGESGGGARALDLGWVRDLIAQCRETETAIFVKQLGAVLGRRFGAGLHGADWSFWPEDLRIREFPHTAEQVTA